MSKTSSRSIGLGGIIFWIFIGYMIFGGDSDNDKKEVEIKVNNDTSVTEEIKKSVNNVKDSIKVILKEIKDAIENEIEERKVEEEITIVEEEDIKKETEPEEKEKEAKLKSLEEISDNQELKKL